MLTSTAPKSPLANAPVLNTVCRGTPWEMGYQQGEALQKKIHQLRKRLTDLEAFRLQQPRYLPYSCYLALAERKANRYMTKALSENRRLSERLLGLAAGAEVEPRTISLFHAMEPILSEVDPETAHAVAAACSAVAIGSGRSVTGSPIVARNFDYLPLVQPFYILRRDEPQVGLRSLVFTTAPMIGAVDGINECGLTITYDYAYALDSSPPAPTISMRIMEVLSQCRTTLEAVNWIQRHCRWGAGLLMLADETGDIAALELSHTRSHLRRPSNSDGMLYHSNGYQSSEIQQVQVPKTARWSQRAPRALRGIRVLASAERRDRRFRELLTQHKTMSAEDLKNIMSDHGPDRVPSRDTICLHGDHWHTTASLQFFPATRKMRVSYASTCTARYQEFQL